MSVSGISLSIAGGNVHIIGAAGEVMEIFNLTGTKVTTIRIDSNDKTFALNLTKGCYLIKVGKIKEIADTSALEADFGFKPATSLRDGLRKFAEWYHSFYQTK